MIMAYLHEFWFKSSNGLWCRLYEFWIKFDNWLWYWYYEFQFKSDECWYIFILLRSIYLYYWGWSDDDYMGFGFSMLLKVSIDMIRYGLLLVNTDILSTYGSWFIYFSWLHPPILSMHMLGYLLFYIYLLMEDSFVVIAVYSLYYYSRFIYLLIHVQ